METRSTAKRKASFESYGILTRNQKQKLEVSLPTFQENNVTSKRRRKTVVETELQKPTNYLDMLPRVPLQVICKYLPVEDIVNTCLVSSRMRDVAADKSTWKGKVLVMKDEKMIDQYINIMCESPQLQGVYIDIGYFYYRERIVEAVRYYLEDLRFLKISYMVYDYINVLLEKFKNLEKIEVGISFLDLPKLLLALRHCSKLKELHVISIDCLLVNPILMASWREEVTEILANSFPSLATLSLPKLQSYLEVENIVRILQEKKNQLVNLSFYLYKIADSEALDIISSCEGLNLNLTISRSCLLFKLDKLKQLKSIKLTLNLYDKNNITDLLVMLSGTPMPNVKVLKLCIFYCPKNMQVRVLEKLVMKFPKLQELVFVGDACNDINDQLSKLSNLSELRSLKLGKLQCLTHCGLSHLLKCTSLRELTFLNIKLNKRCVEYLRKCPLLEKIAVYFRVSRQIRCVLEKLCFERNIILSVKSPCPPSYL